MFEANSQNELLSPSQNPLEPPPSAFSGATYSGVRKD